MNSWLLITLFLTFSALALLLNKRRRRLPPGPLAVPIIGNLLWLRRSIRDIEPILRELHAVHGPIVTLHVGSNPSIFIADRHLAHKALVEHGATFSNRPTPLPATRFLTSNQHIISSAAYGPLWRLLRRNLISEILSQNRVKLYAPGRRWVLGLLCDHLRSSGPPAVPMESFQFAMFSLLVLMCFGEKLSEKDILEIETAQRAALVNVRTLNVFAFAPRLARYVFRKRWDTMVELRRRVAELYMPLIRARRAHKRAPPKQAEEEARYVYSYLDSLLDIQLAEEGGRGLTDDELVSLCSEFLNAGTDTTSTALQWIMASLVTHPEVQNKLAAEINGAVGPEAEEVEEEDLQRMPYLKAVVKEGLRLHPPGHFVLQHAVTEDVEIAGYVVPKKATVNFMVAEMGRDDEVWEKPMEFRPERFLAGGEGEAVDVTGSREIKMMPFGVGRRICPGLGLAMLHLEYFLANLVREFEWKAVEGEEVDMSEKIEFTWVMKNPLRACLIPRSNHKFCGCQKETAKHLYLACPNCNSIWDKWRDISR